MHHFRQTFIPDVVHSQAPKSTRGGAWSRPARTSQPRRRYKPDNTAAGTLLFSPMMADNAKYRTIRRRPSMFNLGRLDKLHVHVEAGPCTQSLGPTRGKALEEIVNRGDYWSVDRPVSNDAFAFPTRDYRSRRKRSAESVATFERTEQRAPGERGKGRLDDPEEYDLSPLGPNTPDFSQFDTTDSEVCYQDIQDAQWTGTGRLTSQKVPTVLEAVLQPPLRPLRRADTRRHRHRHCGHHHSTTNVRSSLYRDPKTPVSRESSVDSLYNGQPPFATGLMGMTLTTPKSTATTLYPCSMTSSPVSSHGTLPVDMMRDHGRLEEGEGIGQAFATELTVSLLAPSTIGLGFSPLSSSASLPASLEAQATDLTEKGRKLPVLAHGSEMAVVPASNISATEAEEKRLSLSATVKRRAALLAQNTFYLPPVHPKPTLRPSTSVRLGVKKEPVSSTTAYTPSLLSPTTAREAKPNAHNHHGHLSPCSSANAIDPLPATHFSSKADQCSTSPQQCSGSGAEAGAGAGAGGEDGSGSLHRLFGLKDFVALSISKAFVGQHPPRVKAKSLQEASLASHENPGAITSRNSSNSENNNRVWREKVFSEAVSLSITSKSRSRKARQTRPRFPPEFLADGRGRPVGPAAADPPVNASIAPDPKTTTGAEAYATRTTLEQTRREACLGTGGVPQVQAPTSGLWTFRHRQRHVNQVEEQERKKTIFKRGKSSLSGDLVDQHSSVSVDSGRPISRFDCQARQLLDNLIRRDEAVDANLEVEQGLRMQQWRQGVGGAGAGWDEIRVGLWKC